MGMRKADARASAGLPLAQRSEDAMIGRALLDAAVKSADLRVRRAAVCHLTAVF
jgi:hypothetical protein